MRFNNLDRYRTGGTGSKMQLSVPLPKTPDGRTYRYSPNEAAQPRHFVLGPVVGEVPLTEALRKRMKQEPRSKQTVCPYSGVVAEDDEFTHPEDRKAALELVKHAAVADVQDELARMFEGLNRSTSRNSIIKITAKVDRSSRPKPRFTRKDLVRELVCDHCGRDYGVYAIGLFCPDCGAPNLRLHFGREVDLVGAQVDLAEGLDVEHEELAYRLLGNAHEDVLTAFEATLKAVYLYRVAQGGGATPPKVGNDFQNLEKARRRFAELSFDPFGYLTADELDMLKLNIQKRHVIGHNLGIVDDKFAPYDPDAKVGETVQLVGEDIRQFAFISQRVVDQLDGWLAGSLSPTIGPTVPLVLKQIATRPDDPDNLGMMDNDLSLLARKVGLWIARHCPTGRGDFVGTDAILADFADVSREQIGEAIAELGVDGFLDLSRTLGGDIPHARPTLDLYLSFDGIAFGTNPLADVAEVGRLALEGPDAVDVDALFAATGWPPRRFTPAINAVAAKIPNGRVMRALGATHGIAAMHLLPEDRVELKRYVARLT
jgi:hypothetical protein